MPLFQYFGWVGSVLLAALFAANWCVSETNARTPGSDVPFEQKINVRIHTDHKWPERVVFDTSSALAQRADAQTGIGGIDAHDCRGTSTFRRVRRYTEQAAFSTALLRRPCRRMGRLAG